MTKLGELISEAMDAQGLSVRQVEAKAGGLIKFTTVNKIRRGEIAFPGDAMLAALAGALGIPLEKLRAARADDAVLDGRLTLPARASDLSPAGKKALLAHLDFLLEQEKDRKRKPTR